MSSCLMSSLAVLVLLLGSSFFVQVATSLRVGAWNIRDFGPTKMGNKDIVGVIVKVMKTYDIIAILEISDINNKTPWDLLAKLNEGSSGAYSLTLSDRVGITSHKEQYGFYWKTSRVTKVSSVTYSDGGKFTYKPFVVLAESVVNSQLKKFGLVAIHTSPDKAVTEISALVDVYNSFKTNAKIEDALIMGDFNAGCTYVKTSDWNSIRLWTDKTFKWLLNNSIDTTTSSTTYCPYDRIVAAGKNMLAVKMAAAVDKYETKFQVSASLATSVSDHYPVYVDFPVAKGAYTRDVGIPSVSQSVVFETTAKLIADFAQSNNHNCSCLDFVADSLTANSIDDALANSKNKYSLVLPQEALEVLEHKVKTGGLQDPTLDDEGTIPTSYDVTLLCQISKNSCTLSLSARTSINLRVH